MNNAKFTFEKLQMGGQECRILVPETDNNCWTISQITAIGPMLREEIRRAKPGKLGFIYELASHFFEFIGRLTKIDDAVFPYSNGFSTNLYNLSEIDFIFDNIGLFQNRYKNKAIILRSLNSKNLNIEILKKYKYLPARIIWHSDELIPKVSARNDTKSDNKAFAKSNLKWANYSKEITREKLQKIIELYNILYLDKYSRHNPDFTKGYLQELLDQEILRFKCLETRNGEIVGFLAINSSATEICAPMIGYDPSYNLAPIYRIIMNEAVNEALNAQKALHHSAGAAKYKANRGFTPLIEYMLIIDSHLPWWRRFGYTIISFVFLKFEKQLLETATK